MPRPRPIRIARACRPPAGLVAAARACSDVLTSRDLDPLFIVPTPLRPIVMAAAKKPAAKAKSSAPASDPAADKVTQLVEATASRLMAARPADAPRDVPGVTQGGKPGPRAHVVGAPMAFGGMSLSALKRLIGPVVKNALELGVQFGGGTIEDLAASQADLLDEFVPDAVYELIEKIAHRMHGGEPHVVGNAPPTGPSAA